MRRRIRMTLLSAVAGLMLLWYAGGSGAQLVLKVGPDAEITADGLHRVEGTTIDAVWVRPDLDLSRYTKIYMMPTDIHFREVEDRLYSVRARASETEFPVSDTMKARLRNLFSETFSEELAEVSSYEMSDEVGRDVLMVQGLLIDVISGVPPDIPGSSVSTIRWAWEASMVIQLRDSMSNDVLARTLVRRRVDGPMQAASVWGLTGPVVRDWSQLLCSHLEELSDLSEL